MMRWTIQGSCGKAGDYNPGPKNVFCGKQDAGTPSLLVSLFAFGSSILTKLQQMVGQDEEWESLLLLEKNGWSRICRRDKILVRLLRPTVLAV